MLLTREARGDGCGEFVRGSGGIHEPQHTMPEDRADQVLRCDRGQTGLPEFTDAPGNGCDHPLHHDVGRIGRGDPVEDPVDRPGAERERRFHQFHAGGFEDRRPLGGCVRGRSAPRGIRKVLASEGRDLAYRSPLPAQPPDLIEYPEIVGRVEAMTAGTPSRPEKVVAPFPRPEKSREIPARRDTVPIL